MTTYPNIDHHHGFGMARGFPGTGAVCRVALLLGAAIAHRRVGYGGTSVVLPAWLATVSAAAVVTGIASL